MGKFASTAYLILLNVLAANAQQDTTTATLDEVVITAQRSAQKKLLSPYSTQSVSRSYLDNYLPRTTPEALTGIRHQAKQLHVTLRPKSVFQYRRPFFN
jgi:outer membrane cobalamin receptor